MRHTILLSVVGFAATAALITGCSSGTSGSPQPTDSSSVTSSASSGGDGAPKVRNPIDVSKYTSNPCSVLSPSQLAQLGISATGSPANTPTGAGCRWQDAGHKLGFTAGPTNGLAPLYANKPNSGFFQPTDINGFPAVDYAVVDQRTSGHCGVGVGTSDDAGWTVNISVGTGQPDYASPCPTAEKVAKLIVSTLKGGS